MNVPLPLYDFESEVGETANVDDKHPRVVRRLLALAEKARKDLGDTRREGETQWPAGWEATPNPLLLSGK